MHRAAPDSARDRLPFEELINPVVLRAREGLARQTGDDLYCLLSPQAHGGWERYLLNRLASAGAKAAYRQFEVYKAVAQVFPYGRHSRPHRSDDLYRLFIGVSADERLRLLLNEFAALSHLHHVLISNWSSAVGEFLKHLHSDWGELSARFAAGRRLGRVTEIEAGLSDPHLGGRTVARLAFEDGTRLIYKPRSVATEHHFYKLLRVINSSGIPHPLKSAKSWNRGAYGWMEDIPNNACAEPSGVKRFYWRAGALMCLVYLANGIDVHRQNMIADGEFPVLIDLETLWHPPEDVARELAVDSLSVLRTGFLPCRTSGKDKAYEWSALCPTATLEHSGWGWTEVNTDDMKWVAVTKSLNDPKNIPTVNGVPAPASEFVGDVNSGFQWMSDWLLTGDCQRKTFSAWLSSLATCPRRKIKRSTGSYRSFLDAITSAEYLRRSGDSSFLPDGFKTTSFDSDEIRALTHLDIPYFAQPADAMAQTPKIYTRENLAQQEHVIAESLLIQVDGG